MSSRPVLILTLAYCIGILLACYAYLLSETLLVWLLPLALLWVFVLRFSARRASMCLLLLAATAGAISCIASIKALHVDYAMHSSACQVKGIVTQVTLSAGRPYQMKVTEVKHAVHSSLVGKNVVVYDEQVTGILPGDVVTVDGVLSVPTLSRNPNEADPRLLLWSKRSSCWLYARSAHVCGESSRTVGSRAVFGARQKISNMLDDVLPESEAAFMKALLLGEADGIDEHTKRGFRSTGVYHVLAVSGLHVHFVLTPLDRMLRKMRIRPALLVEAAALIAFCCLTGMRSSVVRAAIMALLPRLAISTGRVPGGISSLTLAALVMLFINPLLLFDTGFQLSFAATCGLVVASRGIQKPLQILGSKISGCVAPTLAAQLFTIPLLAGKTSFSLRSFAANPIVVPIVGASLCLGMLGSLAGIAGIEPLCRGLLLLAGLLVRCSTQITSLLSRMPLGEHNLPSFRLSESAAYYAASFLVFGVYRPKWWSSVRSRLRANTLILLLVALAGWMPARDWTNSNVLRITFLDVGHGDCILIEHARSALLVDCGTPKAAERTVAPYLINHRVSRNLHIIITHAHQDHAGGLEEICERRSCQSVMTRVPIQTVFETGLLELPEHTLRILEAGYAFTLGHTSQSNRLYFEILWPERGDAVLSENEASVVILLTYDRFRALLTGDSGAVAERAILERSQPERIRCYLLKVGHHGSKGSSSDAFLSACQPVTAVIQAGANRYGHPHADVLTRLELAGARVMRTDVHGAVSIITDGWRVKVSGRLGQ